MNIVIGTKKICQSREKVCNTASIINLYTDIQYTFNKIYLSIYYIIYFLLYLYTNTNDLSLKFKLYNCLILNV